MSFYRISVNQMANFQKGSDAKKRSIIKQQKNPNKFRMAYYQLPKARIRKTLEKRGDLEPILNGISELKARMPIKKRQINDRLVSLEALHRFLLFKLPAILKNTDYSLVKKPVTKSVFFDDVEIIVSPDVIVRYNINSQIYLGAMKIHISKGNKFDNTQQKSVASTLYKYLKDEIAMDNEVVDPRLCLSIDIFGEGIVSAPTNLTKYLGSIFNLCIEVKKLWHQV